MYYFKGTGTLAKNALFTPIFCIMYMNCSENHLKSILLSTLSCLSSSATQEKPNIGKQKGHSWLKNLQHSPEWQNYRKEKQIYFSIFAAFSRIIKTQKRRTSDWKNWFYYIKWQKHKIRSHCFLQKLTWICENLINILINVKKHKKRTSCHSNSKI